MTVCAGALLTYGYIALWIALSTSVILLNKVILAYTGFPFPVALTLSHMGFSSLLSFSIVQLGLVPNAGMETAFYMRNVLPIAALFSGTLWMGNAAYVYLSVSFIQMLKALMPVSVFLVGVFLGTEKYSSMYLSNVALVAVGVAVASHGELNFNLIGVAAQLTSIVTESVRLCLIQLLLQARGIKFNPITTLYYIAPACFVFLCIPFAFLELPVILHTEDLVLPWGWVTLSAICAFALNLSVFLLIGRSSALTMNIAGVVKDWILIILSVAWFRAPVTRQQFLGYGIAFAGVCWYNYLKASARPVQDTAQSIETVDAVDAEAATLSPKEEEGRPLLGPVK